MNKRKKYWNRLMLGLTLLLIVIILWIKVEKHGIIALSRRNMARDESVFLGIEGLIYMISIALSVIGVIWITQGIIYLIRNPKIKK